jgi:hypothetical protein
MRQSVHSTSSPFCSNPFGGTIRPNVTANPIPIKSQHLTSGVHLKTIPAFRFTTSELDALARENASRFASNQPFPHVVIEDFLPAEIANAIAEEFPKPNDIPWRLVGPGDSAHTNDPDVEKLGASREDVFPPLIRHVMHEFNSQTFVGFLEILTQFKMLSPDPAFCGCGMHSTGRGGRLMIHADASRHQNPKFQQLLNMIYYVTPDWQEEWGGHLELWSPDRSECVRRITPKFNSVLVFFSGTKSYHGHPHPLTTPKGIRRNSLSAYFYTTHVSPENKLDTYRNYAEWVRTNDLDRNKWLVHWGKATVRLFPSPRVNRAATMVRRIKRWRAS